jgi:two-component system, LuxR family, response regulator FixJ
MYTAATVLLVDDDSAIRDAMSWTLRSVGLSVESCASPDELLRSSRPDLSGCFVIDLQLPGMNGFELQKRLRQKGCLQPFIIVSGHANVSLAVQAMHLGAIDFIEKPFNHQLLLDSVQKAIERDVGQRRRRADQADIQKKLDELTDRERQVLDLVVCGELSKRIASQLRISVKTVEAHRSNIRKKMDIDSVAQLTSLVTRLSLAAP